MDVFLTFYTLRVGFLKKWLRFNNLRYDHCSVVLRKKGVPMVCLHVCSKRRPRFVREVAMHEIMEPKKVYYMGETSVPYEELQKVLEKGKKFSVVKCILWYYIIRWCTQRKPKWFCCSVCCRILNKCKLYDKIIVIPDELEKELSDANSFYSWSSGFGEDNCS